MFITVLVRNEKKRLVIRHEHARGNRMSYQYSGLRTTLCAGIRDHGAVQTKLIKIVPSIRQINPGHEECTGELVKIASNDSIRMLEFHSCFSISSSKSTLELSSFSILGLPGFWMLTILGVIFCYLVSELDEVSIEGRSSWQMADTIFIPKLSSATMPMRLLWFLILFMSCRFQLQVVWIEATELSSMIDTLVM